MSEKLNKIREDYFSNKILDIYHFFTKEQLEIMNKLGEIVEDKKYSTYDFDVLQSNIIKYYKEREKLKEKNVTNEEYEDILIVLDKISENYNI